MSVWGDSSLRFPPEIYKIIRHEKNIIPRRARFPMGRAVRWLLPLVPIRLFSFRPDLQKRVSSRRNGIIYLYRHVKRYLYSHSTMNLWWHAIANDPTQKRPQNLPNVTSFRLESDFRHHPYIFTYTSKNSSSMFLIARVSSIRQPIFWRIISAAS